MKGERARKVARLDSAWENAHPGESPCGRGAPWGFLPCRLPDGHTGSHLTVDARGYTYEFHARATPAPGHLMRQVEKLTLRVAELEDENARLRAELAGAMRAWRPMTAAM